MSRYKRLLVLTFAFSLANSGTANAALPPRISANAYASTDYTIGEADLMLPMAGDRRHNFYADPTVAYGTDNQGTADLGLGYRWIKKDAAIFGVYLFGGYTRIDNNARLWVANPGLEALGSRWDAHLNAYLPMGDRHTTVSVFPKNFFFTGHSLFSDLNNLSQYAGAGGDISIGGQLFSESPLKAYVGSYFFNPAQTNHIWGGAAGLEYWLDNNIKVFASYTYDSLRHSTAAFGMGVELGGTHTTRINPTLEERMTDPVGRYLADLGRGSAIPSRLKARPIPNTFYLYQNNIAFFSQTGAPNNGGLGLSLANCTFENPCGPIDFTNQATTTLNSLLPSTLFAFEDGAFSATDVPGGVNPVTVRTGQSITSIGSTPATLVGGFILEGNNSVNRISLQPTASTATGPGITVLAGNNQITSTQIGSTATPFAIGLRTLDSSGTLISNSTIFASSVGIQNEDDGFTVLSASNLEVDAGTNPGIGINSIGNSITGIGGGSVVTVNGGANSIGVRSASSDLMIINASQIQVTGGNGTVGVDNLGDGALILSNQSISVTGGNNSIGIKDSSTALLTVGNSAINVSGGTNTIGIDYFGSGGLNVDGSSITVTGGNNSSGVVVEGGSSGNVNLRNSSVVVDPTAIFVTGINILSGSASNIAVNSSQISVIGGDNAIGINNLGNGMTNLSNNSVVKVTGGNNSVGISDASSALMTINNSSINTSGGTNTIGIDYLGSGGTNLQSSFVDVTGANNSSGMAVEASSSGAVTVNNSQIKITAEDNTIGLSNLGNGVTNLSNNSVVTAIGDNTTGILNSPAVSSLMTVDGSSINVLGGGITIGVMNSGVGAFNLFNNSAISVVGGGNNATGIRSSSSGLMATSGRCSVKVFSNGTTIGIDYLGSGGIDLGGDSIEVTGANNSSGVVIEGSSSGDVGLSAISVTANLGNATGGTGINILPGSTSRVISFAHSINVSGGDNTIGINNLGNGTTDITGLDFVKVTGGNNTRGINDSSSASMTVDGFPITISGGSNTVGIDYLGSGGISLQAISIDVTGTNNSSGVMVEGSSSGTVNLTSRDLTSSFVTVTLGSATGGTGVNVLSGSASTVTVNGSQINVSGGDNTTGLNNSGNGSTNLSNGSTVTVTGGNNSGGISDSSTTLMTIDNSSINVSGGASNFGIRYLGSGGMNLTGSTLNMTGGDNVTGFLYGPNMGTGTINITGNTLTVNAGSNNSGATGMNLFPSDNSTVNFSTSRIQLSGGSNTSGVIAQGQVNAIIIDVNAIFVTGQTGFSYGVRALDSSTVPITRGTIYVQQAVSGAPVGVEADGNSIITNTQTNLNISGNNTQSVGAVTTVNGFINFNDNSSITVSGNSFSAIDLSNGGTVVIGGTTVCNLNGMFVLC